MTYYWAKVKTVFEGIHKYSEAPEECAFLRYPHRHQFHVTLWLQQFHDKRDIEFIKLKRELNALVEKLPNDESDSCERMACFIADIILQNYPGRRIRIEVAEDDENAALLEFD